MSKFLGILKQAFKKSTAYRFEYLFTLIIAPISLIVTYFLWKAIYLNTGNTIAGFSFNELITYYVLTWIVFTLTWSTVEDEMRTEIRSGRMTTEIIKPINYLLYKFFVNIGQRLFSLFTEGIPLIAVGLVFLKIKLSLAFLPLSVISVMLAFTLNFLLSSVTGMSSFWFVNNAGIKKFRRILTSFLGGNILPISFFPASAQQIMSFLPFQYINFVPIMIFMGKYSLREAVIGIALQAVWIAIFYLICLFIWKKAIRKYTAVGT